MVIYRIIVNKKPDLCKSCPIYTMNVCGREEPRRGTSGSMYITKVPDDKCRIRVGNR